MHRTVDFDCQVQLRTVEVHNEPVDHMLPAELEAQTSPVPQERPGSCFCWRRLTAVGLRERDLQRPLSHFVPRGRSRQGGAREARSRYPFRLHRTLFLHTPPLHERGEGARGVRSNVERGTGGEVTFPRCRFPSPAADFSSEPPAPSSPPRWATASSSSPPPSRSRGTTWSFRASRTSSRASASPASPTSIY